MESAIAASTRHDPEALIRLIQESLDEDKAEDVVSIDLRGKASFADYMVIASGRSQRHITTLAEHLAESLKAAGFEAHLEGSKQSDWVLVDCFDVVVHLFKPEVRTFYNLEKMWKIPLAAEPEQQPLVVA